MKTLLFIFCLLLSLSANTQGLNIRPGAQLVSNGAVKLVLNNAGITNNGLIVPSTSTFVFTGTAAGSASFIGGSSTSSFYNLTMNKTSNGMQLDGEIEVSNTLTLQSGDSLFLNNHTIELGYTGTLSGETNSRRITGYNGGYIEAMATLDNVLAAEPGNLGISFTTALLKNMGNTIIRRGHQVQAGGSVRRYYDIIPSNNSDLDATVTFYYFDSELNNNNEALLDYFSSSDGGANWTHEGSLDINLLLNNVTGNFASFDRLTIGNLPNIVLPLRSVTLSGNATPKQFKLHWLAAGITANGVSVIEKSSDGAVYTHVASLPYSVTNGEQQHFNWIDNAISDQVYYRIKAVNQAGKTIYSNVLLLQRGSNTSFQIYPNPARGSIQFIANYIAAKTIDIGIYALNGQLVQQQIAIVQEEKVQQRINISNLPAGIYVIRSAAIPLAQQLFTVY